MTMPIGGEPIKTYRMKLDGKFTGKHVDLRDVPVDLIRRETKYQRGLNETWLHSHMPFVPEQAGTVTLSERAHVLWAVDGGHRVELAKASGVKTIKAFVIKDLTLQEEAALFVRLQRERRALSAWDLYRAELAGNEEHTVAMTHAISLAGFRIDQQTKGDPKVITAIDSMRFVYRMGGAPLIKWVLELITDAMWLNLDRALSGPILKGLAIFLHSEQQRAVYDHERTVRILQRAAPTYVLLKAQQISIERRAASVSATNVAQAILDAYNDRLSVAKKLPPITINNRKRPEPKRTKPA